LNDQNPFKVSGVKEGKKKQKKNGEKEEERRRKKKKEEGVKHRGNIVN
jgi:hypothetical protein